jgi:hypothetical protein
MPWKTTTPWLVGLAAAAGYVWFKRSITGPGAQPFGKTSEVDEDELADSNFELSAPASEIVRGYVRAEQDELRALARDTEVPPVATEIARADALHDMRLSDLAKEELRDDDLGDRITLDADELDVFDSEPEIWDDDVDPISVLDRPENVHPSEHVVSPDETYDAVAPEDLGSEWLLRATEAGGPQERSPDEMLDGTQVVIDMNENALEESEVPLVIDDAEELPLGEIDRNDGHTELHGRSDVRSRIRNNLDSELVSSPNETELANRAAGLASAPAARKRHG